MPRINTQFKKGIIPWNKGKKNPYSKETLKRMSDVKIGKKTGPMEEKDRIRLVTSNIGRVFTQEHRDKIRDKLKGKKAPHREGKNNNLWRGGFTPTIKLLRSCFKYRQWRSDVYTRDNFICNDCNKKGGILNAHHIKSFTEMVKENNIKSYEEGINCDELWNINNGATLCVECHRKTDNFAGKVKSNNKIKI